MIVPYSLNSPVVFYRPTSKKAGDPRPHLRNMAVNALQAAVNANMWLHLGPADVTAATTWRLEAARTQQLLERATAAINQLADLMVLDPNWDGYGGRPMDAFAVQTALDLVLLAAAEAIDNHLPNRDPFIAPLPSGGVQVEWRSPTFEIEAEVTPGGQVTVSSYDLVTRQETEEDATNERGPILRAVRELDRSHLTVPV